MAVRRHGGSTCPPLLRKVLLWSLAAFGALILLGFIGYAQLLAYLQGESFRDSLEKALAGKAQATSAHISGTLGLDANRVSMQGLTLHRSGLVQAVEGKSIHAELNRSALLERELHLNRLVVEEASLSLRLNKDATPARARTGKPTGKREATGFLSRIIPTHARLDQLDCKDFNATLHLGENTYSLADCALSAHPLKKKGAWEYRLSNGRVRTPLPIIGDSSLKAATLSMGGKLTTLSDARLMLSPGELIINAVHETASGNWSADIRANSLDISRFIGEDWKKRLTGDLYGRLRADGHAEGLRQAEGNVSLQQGTIEALPFLSNLPVGNSYPYRCLKLEKATARISYPHADPARNIREAWLLDQIDLRAAGGWLRVQGHALVDADGSLGGTLLIGIPDAVAGKLAPAGSALCQSIFNAEGEAGYQWLRLNLSGSLNSPQEDLSVRLMTLIGSSLPQAADVLQGLLPPAKPQAEEKPAEAPAATAPEGEPAPAPAGLMQKAGEAAGELINSGLRSIF